MAGLPTRFKNGDSLYQPLADINVTPLVDVMLVLLIIFMVTAPLLAKGMKVNLPQSKAAQPLNPKEPIVIVVSKEGKVALGADEVAPEALVDMVRAAMGDDLSRVVHLRGDKEANYGEVIAVMDRLAMNGITHLAILTDSRSKTGQAAAGVAPAVGAAPAAAPAPAAVPAPAGGAAK
ncbi:MULTISPECIES: ExbD/TolR family protein [Methylosinus]|uniref:Biopolymer transporter ExbD n=1 Tax=Methylosinus trichosporium (strain ATCC 35070 / NCIMB 11131 / UNIQEM 75 / OB3b) TaxID=595536 RepID=A0A2D2D460_METT3|nr:MULTISPECIES: biopolymer transporter ExbD [Methylosinus]ATQ69744.1 biopolymer transporter ExbD [Methylosinus trichosporium OB3b]OBS52457.1 biopolymer transporter ExbD [Methylosinus sp. 3S-1]